MMSWLLVLALTAPILAIPIDNGVEGDPEIECGPTSITVSFNTRNPFEGHVYVKGLYSDETCRNSETGGRVATLQLPFDSCNTQRERRLDPRGIFVIATVVISFHPQFVTKVDRAYRVQCFYMEADKTVSQELEVSMLTTAFQTQVVPMPVCRYEILDGGPTGEPVKYALIGQAVYHKWTCDSETTDTFCMRVYSCFVDDGNNDRVDLINEEGCALDKYLLRNLEYLGDLSAGQEAHVFKYADRAQLFFNCQVEVSIKEPAGTCPQPECPEPGSAITGSGSSGRAFRRRFFRSKRSLRDNESVGIVDVLAEMSALDLDPSNETPKLPESLRHKPHQPLSHTFRHMEITSQGVCLSSPVFGVLLAVSVILFIAAAITVLMLCNRQPKSA